MLGELRPYSVYKDSAVSWLGEVPEHWDCLPGRACLSEKCTPNKGMKESTVLSISYGRIIIKSKDKHHGLVPASFETYQIIEPGDIILRPTDLQNDQTSLRFGLSRNRGIITSAYLCLVTKPVLICDYGYLLLHTYDTEKVFYGLGSGLRQNLDWTDFKFLPCLVPPSDEQTAIVRFIEYMDRRIRRYIRAKQNLIKLLEEQKQVIIHHAVTRGLDPNVRFKPSGVALLGDVPAHWELRRLRYVAEMRVSNIDKHTKEGELPVRLCNYVDVYKNDRITDQLSFMRVTAKSDEIDNFRLELDDVIITKDSEEWNDIGVPALVEYAAKDLVCGYHLAILRPNNGLMIGAFLLRVLQDPDIAYQFHVSANGVTRYGLSHDSIKAVLIPLPPPLEQSAIVSFLNEAIANLDSIIAVSHREITLLREFRIRLIADVVTGKLDVREIATRLPEETEEPEPLDDTEALAEGDENSEGADLDTTSEEAEA